MAEPKFDNTRALQLTMGQGATAPAEAPEPVVEPAPEPESAVEAVAEPEVVEESHVEEA